MKVKDYSKYEQDEYKLPDYLLPKLPLIRNIKENLRKLNPDDFLFSFSADNKYNSNFSKFIKSITPPYRIQSGSARIYLVKKAPNGVANQPTVKLNKSNYKYVKSIIFEAIDNLTI